MCFVPTWSIFTGLVTFMHTNFILFSPVIIAQLPPENPDTIVFPNKSFHAQIVIPANAIIFQRSHEGTYGFAYT